MEITGKKKRYGFDLSTRKQIQEMRSRGCSAEVIAARLGAHYTTIYRELKRGCTGETDENGAPVYDAELAQRRAAIARANKGKKSGPDDRRIRRTGRNL